MNARSAGIVGLFVVGLAVASFGLRGRRSAGSPHGEGTTRVGDPSPSPPPLPLAATELSGCETTRADGVCETGGGDDLSVWVEAPVARASVSMDRAGSEAARASAVEGGTRFDLKTAPGARALVVAVDGRPVASFALAPSVPQPAPLIEARRLRRQGKLAEAEALVVPLASSPDPITRVRALGLYALLALSRGDAPAIDARFEAALAAASEAGRASDAANDAIAWSYSLIERGSFARAREVIDRMQSASTEYSEGRATVEYYQGTIAERTGHPRVALEQFRRATVHCNRANLAELGRGVRREEAVTEIALGRAAEGLDDLVALRASGHAEMSGCAEATLVDEIARLALNVSGSPHGDPRDLLNEALALHEKNCPPDDNIDSAAESLGNLALAEVARGDFKTARVRLQEARATIPHPNAFTELEWIETEGRIALGLGDRGGALRAFDRFRQRALSLGASDSVRLASTRRAEALAAMGDRAGAVAALEEASTLLETASIEVPLGEGREGYLRDGEMGDERAIALLVSLGRPARALVDLRRARARGLAALVRADQLDALTPEQRTRWEAAVATYRVEREAIDEDAAADWRLSAATLTTHEHARAERSTAARSALEGALAELPRDPRTTTLPPLSDADGDVTLAFTSGERAWIGLAAARGEVRATTFAPPDPSASPDALAASLLAPFHDALADARHVAVFAFGAARRLDVHALPLDGTPLGARVPVVYPLDRAPSAASADTRGPALLVGDPTNDLEAARAETQAVRGALAQGGRAVRVLAGSAATGEAVRAGLAEASLFHYAGHGRFAGRDGWESALPLAEHGDLAVTDILALPHCPPTVVLLGCDTARASHAAGDVGSDGLGLGQAFVIAGAREVLAATRTIDDGDAARIASALYAALARGSDLATATRDAARALAPRGDTDWSAFRVLVP